MFILINNQDLQQYVKITSFVLMKKKNDFSCQDA